MTNNSYISDVDMWRKDFSFYIDIKIRFSETDMFGHMNNVSPFVYFEQARIELMKQINLFNFKENLDVVPIVADLQCDYQAQVYFDEEIKLYTKAASVGNSSVDIHYMALKEDGTICFTGRGTLVKIDAKKGKSLPFTKEERVKLENI